MRLLKLELCNFRQYKFQEIIFPQDGLIGILGNNGAGKSTLFNAIGWCLYGKIKGVTNAMIKNQSAGKKDECYVILDFLFQNQHFRVRRDLVSSRCYAQVDGMVRAIGTTNLNAFIEEDVFKMDHAAFCTCYYAEQDDFDALVKLNPGPRVQTLSKLVRIETIDKAAENARKDYRLLEMEVNESRKHLKDEHVLLEEKKQQQASIQHSKNDLEVILKDIIQLQENHQRSLLQKNEGEQKYREFERLKNEKNNALSQIQTLKEHSLSGNEAALAKLEKAKTKYEEVHHYKEIYQSLKKEKENFSNARLGFQEKSTVEKDMKLIKTEVKEYMKEIETLTSSLSSFHDLETSITKTEDTLSFIQKEIEELSEKVQGFSFSMKAKKEEFEKLKADKNHFSVLGTGVPCPTCKQEMGEEHLEKELKRMDQDLHRLVSEAKFLQEEASKTDQVRKEKRTMQAELSNQLDVLRKQLVQKNKWNERLGLLTAEVEKRKNTFQSLQIRFEKVKDVSFDEQKFKEISLEFEKVSKMYEEILRAEDAIKGIDDLKNVIKKTTEKINEYEKIISKAEGNIQLLHFDEDAFLNIQHEIENNQRLIDEKKEEKSNKEKTMLISENEIKSIEEKIADNQRILSSIKAKEKEMVLLGKLDEVYKGYKTDKLKKLVPALSSIMSDYIEVITDGKYDQIELDDKFNIFIYRNGVKNTLDFYSGGEKKLAALCQRLAISGLLVGQTGQANFDMLAMDEVFGAMDGERQDSIMDMLRNLNETFPQILMVAHNEHVKELFDYVLEIKQDQNGFSTTHWSTDWNQDEVIEIVEEFEEADEDSEAS